MGKIKSFLLSFWVIGLMAGCDASLERLELHETTELLKEPGLQNLGFPEKQVAILPRGTKVVVLIWVSKVSKVSKVSQIRHLAPFHLGGKVKFQA